MLSRQLLLVSLLWAMAPASASACSIPVFRYALERWRAEREDDMYHVVIFHRGVFTAYQQNDRDILRALSDDRAPKANFVVELVNVNDSGKMTPAQRALWQTQKDPPLPWVVLRYPEDDSKRPSPWAGPLNEQTVRLLTDSPVRQELARRILRGDSVVWVLLECGNQEEDDAAAKRLQAELKRLEKVVELPEGLGEGPVKLLSDLPVRIAFSMLRVSRTDAAEQVLVGMLLHSEEDLPQEKGPMAFPVFGRGRFLEGLVGKGINPDVIQSASQFLCAACSCRVKRLNPGADLLMMVEWDARLDAAREPEPEKLRHEGQPVPIATGELPPTQPVVVEEVVATWPWQRVGQNLAVLALTGGGLAALLLIVWAVTRRRETSTSAEN
jgi:hypothetical protein